MEHGWGCYQPKGEILGIVVEVNHLDSFNVSSVMEFQAPWRDTMIVRPGDMLVVPAEKDEIYRIAKKEFGETYVEL